jgi:hypothetical protein
VFRSETRGGLFEPSISPIGYTSVTTWTDIDRLLSSGESYYFVMPVDIADELGSSTYSVGVQTIMYSAGSDTFSIPLNTTYRSALDDFCGVVSNVAGISYVVHDVWRFHSLEMPAGVYDSDVLMGEGFQISIDDQATTSWTFVGH